jgi:hypothetical protein
MPLYRKSQFAQLCKVDPGTITKAITAGKIILATDGERINTKKKQNQEFLEQKQKEARDREIKEQAKLERAKKMVQEMPAKAQAKEEADSMADDDVLEWDLDRKKKLRDIELKEMNIRLKKIEETRLKGELIPRAFVKQVFEIYNTAVTDSFKNAADTFRINLATQLKLKPKISAAMHKDLTDMINDAQEEAMVLAKAEMRRAFEAAKQKGGQRDG